MGWSFHKQRNKRYQIALKQLFKTFSQQEGQSLIDQFKKQKTLSRTEKKLLKHLIVIEKALVLINRNPRHNHNRFLKALRQLLVILNKSEKYESYQERIERLCLEFCKTKFYRVHLFQFGHHLLSTLFASLSSQAKFKTVNYIHLF